MNTLQSIQYQLIESLKKTRTMRTCNQSSEYKTVMDSIERLYGMVEKYSDLEKHFHRVNDRLHTYYILDEENEKFYNSISSIAKSEIEGINIHLEKLLKHGEYKDHRDWIISLDKMLRIKEKVERLLDKCVKIKK